MAPVVPPPVALPPGIYTVQSVIAQTFLADAGAGAQPLRLQAASAQWLITGDGIIKSLTNRGSSGYASLVRPTPPVAGRIVIRAVSVPQTGWIINVAVNETGTHTGTIMTNDGTNLFWAPNTAGGQVLLQARIQPPSVEQQWIFSPPAGAAP